jgi:uncharacterized protein YgiM (DUF1202 family)
MNAKSIRTTVIFLAVLALFAGLLTPSLTAKAAEGTTGTVIVDKLNFREGPGFSYDVIKVLSRGTTVTVIETSSDGLWLQVRLADNSLGYVYRNYIQVSTVVSAEGTVLVDVLNLRAGPGSSYKVLDVLKKGESLTISGRSLYSDWLMVKTSDDVQGWVFSPLVQTSVAIADLPVTEAYGGPDGSPTSSTPMSLVITIRDNEGVITVRNFPANSKISAWLGLSSSSLDLKVASGTTSASGNAELTFEMPEEWSNGNEVESGTMVLVVKTDDGSFSKTATIQYYTY